MPITMFMLVYCNGNANNIIHAYMLSLIKMENQYLSSVFFTTINNGSLAIIRAFTMDSIGIVV